MSATVFAGISLLLFGVWGFMAKIATDAAGWRTVFVFSQLPYILLGTGMLVLAGPYALKWTSLRWVLLGGLAGAFGVLFFLIAVDRSSASRVIPITAVYPAVTVLLSWLFLNESLTIKRIGGVVLAIAGVALLA